MSNPADAASGEPKRRVILHDPAPTGSSHYTSLEGFRAIVETKKIWLTHSGFLSDFTEGRSAARLLVARYEKLFRDRSFISAAVALNAARDRILGIDAHYYVTCFCERGDLLSQWRAYAADGNGVSMAMALETIASVIPATAHVGSCTYVHPVPRGHILPAEAFRELDAEFERRGWGWALQADGNTPTFAPHLDEAIDVIATYLRSAGIFLKDGAFAEERESRVAVLVADAEEAGCMVQYRPTPRGLVPYIEVDLSEVPHWLYQVTLGPGISDAENVASVTAFLFRHGIRIEVFPSTAPYRPR